MEQPPPPAPSSRNGNSNNNNNNNKRNQSELNTPFNDFLPAAETVNKKPKMAPIDQAALQALDSHSITRLVHLISKLKDIDAERSHVLRDIHSIYAGFDQEGYMDLLSFLNHSIGALKANAPANVHPADEMSFRKKVKAKRTHEKDLVLTFLKMVTDHQLPETEDSGIEKQKLWQFFDDFQPESNDTKRIASPVFWKYLKGHKYKAPPEEVVDQPQTLKTVLKGGVKRMSGVRWLNPDDPNDMKQSQEAHAHLNSEGFVFDFDKVITRLKLLFEDHEASEKARRAAHNNHHPPHHHHHHTPAPAANNPQSFSPLDSSVLLRSQPIPMTPSGSSLDPNLVIVPDTNDLQGVPSSGLMSPSLSQFLPPSSMNPSMMQPLVGGLNVSSNGLSTSTAELLMNVFGSNEANPNLVSGSEKWQNPLLGSWDPALLSASNPGASSPTGRDVPRGGSLS